MMGSAPSQSTWQRFWFRPISASGFGLMRVGYGVLGCITFALQWNTIEKLYSTNGILPHDLIQNVMRTDARFSLLDTASPELVWILYIVLLLAFLGTALGIWTRLMVGISVVLLFSFHEYSTIALDGGDTMMRLIGFILLVSPSHRAMTITNLWKRMQRVRNTGTDQPRSERMLPIWPYRLLLWQMIIIYLASSIEKLSGFTWQEGSAVAIVLHHDTFSRLPTAWADALTPLSPLLGWFVLITQLAWILLLIVPLFIWFRVLPHQSQEALKRALLLSGVLIHGAIFLIMDVGTFSLTIFAAYLGLLLSEDIEAIRKVLNRKFSEPLIVLFDGRCSLCRRSVVALKAFDWLHRLKFANFRDAEVKKEHEKSVSMEELDREIHILHQKKYEKGYFGFRVMSWHLPPLWILMPLLYIPGVPMIGEKIYAFIAKNRPRCKDDNCTL